MEVDGGVKAGVAKYLSGKPVANNNMLECVLLEPLRYLFSILQI